MFLCPYILDGLTSTIGHYFCNDSSDTHGFHHHLNFAHVSCHFFGHFPSELTMMQDREAGPLTRSVNISNPSKALGRNLLSFLGQTRGWTISSPFQPKSFYEMFL